MSSSNDQHECHPSIHSSTVHPQRSPQLQSSILPFLVSSENSHYDPHNRLARRSNTPVRPRCQAVLPCRFSNGVLQSRASCAHQLLTKAMYFMAYNHKKSGAPCFVRSAEVTWTNHWMACVSTGFCHGQYGSEKLSLTLYFRLISSSCSDLFCLALSR